jgi:hypothetical protein
MRGGLDGDRTITSKVGDLSRLGARLGPTTLIGLMLEEVRQLYHEGTGR